jgi:hypothetical protein
MVWNPHPPHPVLMRTPFPPTFAIFTGAFFLRETSPRSEIPVTGFACKVEIPVRRRNPGRIRLIFLRGIRDRKQIIEV